jgi:hypothetical protein
VLLAGFVLDPSSGILIRLGLIAVGLIAVVLLAVLRPFRRLRLVVTAQEVSHAAGTPSPNG